MENLTKEQKDLIRQSVGKIKYQQIAALANCSLEDVRQFVVSPEEWARAQEEQRAYRAAQEARRQAFHARAKELLVAGDMQALFEHWSDESSQEIIDRTEQKHYDVRDEIANDMVRDFLVDNEDEIDGEFRRQISDEIDKQIKASYQKFLDDLRHVNQPVMQT